ncbi:2-oxo-4-hydroxy-4-carboxy-5-ureidoimidazoline decarboxylase [Streptomyces sp. SPB4]|uniref:2-oxo-4-hydroxy-4-carboxy-5-ureidoimidazoline decarboxylase n=1 Tax=Streptomyces sp. SPB4 TaxID=2940553 RepID=UPI0032AEB7A8
MAASVALPCFRPLHTPARVILSAHLRVKSPYRRDTHPRRSLAWRHTRATPPRRTPLSSHLPAQVRGPVSAPGTGLTHFNALPPDTARTALAHCCGSRRWAQRMAAHRPYPDVASLLAGADEAAYDMSQGDLTEALARESSAELGHGAPYAALLALDAARAEYERTFGHAFVICLDGHPPEERVDQLLAAIRRRLAHEVDEERSIAADELRMVARSRLTRLLARLAEPHREGPDDGLSEADFGLFAPVG